MIYIYIYDIYYGIYYIDIYYIEFEIQDLPRGYYVVYKRTTPIFYCSQEVLSKIPKPIENNRKWVWWVYKRL